MKLIILLLLVCLAVVCLAGKENKKQEKGKIKFGKKTVKTASKVQDEDEDGKVEVDTEEKPEEKKGKKKARKQEVEADENEEPEEEEEEEDEEEEEEVDPNAKIEVEDLYIPKDCKNKTKSGDQVVVHYTGWMDDGSLFDTTIDQRKNYLPFEFILGSGTVIKGFEEALTGMCRSQKRKVVIPPALAYGKKGTPDIPGNTTLTYDLELLDVRKPAPHHDMFSYMDKNGDGKLTREEVSNYMRIQAEARFAPVHDERWQQEHDKMVDSVFEQEDLDEDGIISHDEFSGPKIKKRSHDEF